MKIPLYTFLCSLTALIAVNSSAQVNYDNWNFQIRAQNSQLIDTLAMLGVRPDATSGFDFAYDVPRPPQPPSGSFLETYFPHSGGNYPPQFGSKYAVDYQGPSDPVWSMSVDASDAGPIKLYWDSVYVNSIESRVQLFLHDIAGGMYVNMRTQGSYTFSFSSKRDFEIVGAAKIDLKVLMEGFWNGTTQVQDTVTGYLAAPGSPHAFADSGKLYLSAAGTGMLVFPNAPSGNYYLVIRHRNHLETWSAESMPLAKTTTSYSAYDYSTGPGQAYGLNALKQVGSVYVTWGGDVNQDHVVDFRDRNLTWNNRGQSGYYSSDCNGDNTTDSTDYNIVQDNRLKVYQRP